MFRFIVTMILMLVSIPVFAQDMGGMDMGKKKEHETQEPAAKDPDAKQVSEGTQEAHQMPGMSMGDPSNVQPATFIEEIVHHGSSGTSAEPNSTPVPMLMTMKGKWTLMFHMSAFVNVMQQSGPQGGDKVFSTNWFMPMAQRKDRKSVV